MQASRASPRDEMSPLGISARAPSFTILPHRGRTTHISAEGLQQDPDG